MTRQAAHKYYEPHKFITFLKHAESAFEWVGSVNCYYLSEDEISRHRFHRIYYGPKNIDIVQPLYYRDNLHEQLKKLAENARYCSLLEIYSEWGAKEYPGNHWNPSPEWIPQDREAFCYQEVLFRGINYCYWNL